MVCCPLPTLPNARINELHKAEAAGLGRQVEHLVLGRRARGERPIQIVLIQLGKVLAIFDRVGHAAHILDARAESRHVRHRTRYLGNYTREKS